MQTEWEMRRSKFNHDWLQNQFLNALCAFLTRLSRRNLEPAALEEFAAVDFLEWREHEPEAHWLIESFDEQTSPKLLFAVAPLNQCSPDTMSWLPALVHELWLARYPVRMLQERGRGILVLLTQNSCQLSRQLETPNWHDANFVKRIRRGFNNFREEVEQFSAVLGSMREEVKPL